MLPKNANRKIILIILFAFLALNIFFIGYHIYFAQKIIPGVAIGNTEIGGLTPDQAEEVLQKNAPNANTRIFFKFKQNTYETTLDEVDLKYDWNATLKKAVETGRSGNFIKDTSAKFAGLVYKIRIVPVYTYDKEAFSAFASQIDGGVNVAKIDAQFILTPQGDLTISSEKEGSAIEIEKLNEELNKSLENLEFKIAELPVVITKPEITTKDLETIKPQVEKLISKRISATKDKESVLPTPTQLLKYLKFEKDGKEVKVSFDKTKANDFVEQANLLVYESPRGKITKNSSGKVTDLDIVKSGKELDKEKFLEEFEETLLSDKESFEIPTKSFEGPQDVEKYGITTLIGSGNSSYQGSAASREKNLLLAAERINGVLIPPNGVFSFNKNVGDISAANGYDSAYIIQNGRTVLGDGGGVCQTSTTLFRAVLNTGLDVVLRHPHAYRVVYYEQGSPAGLDASIFQPSLDFQFKNDTKNYVLLETTHNKEKQTLTFNFYGTDDGRKVEVSKPTLTDQAPAPEAQYIDDPTLPKGVTKQVDFAAPGGKASFTRKVTREGETLHDDIFTSVYRPWRAVYMVGTKD